MTVPGTSATSLFAAADQRFEAAVRAWVIDALRQGVRSFGELTRRLPGVDPSQVKASLADLDGVDPLLASTAAAVLATCHASLPTAHPTLERPLPHPLEFYWRNDGPSVERLVERVAEAGEGTTIAYLGTPNVFVSACQRLPDQRHVLLDRSVHRTRALSDVGEVELVDLLCGPLPDLRADVVVTDPPWYPEHLRSFLWAGAELLRNGGRLYASFPPDGTRPTVGTEREELLTWADSIGLRLAERQKCALRYISAPFELSSHRAAGLGGIPLDWRGADLVAFERGLGTRAPRPPLPVDEELWLQFSVDGIPIWVRDRENELFDIGERLIQPLVNGDVLTTVSRRNPVRARVDVWTSLNRVYATSHPGVVQAVCRALAESADPIDAVSVELERHLTREEGEVVSRCASWLREIVDREKEEHGL